MKILVSACLTGENCKYNGLNNYNERLCEFLKGHEVVSVCPEIIGGLKTPRSPVELLGGVAINRDGENVDEEFRHGAKTCVEIAKREKVDLCILQSRSPSCGVNQIYDGSFTGIKIEGQGVFAKMLMENGFKVLDVTDLDSFIKNEKVGV